MNKVIQANLGGIAFTFDDAAYAHLDDYLAKINGYFRGTAGHTDIMHDIEARLAELFTQNLKGRSIVTAEDVDAATATLGTPEQVGGAADELDDTTERSTRSGSRAYDSARERRRTGRQGYSRYGKKLMRDPEEKVIGGVCAGFSAYFGVENPAWFRIGAVLAAVASGGTAILAYLVLWAALPVPRTSGDWLAMRGEPIDIDGISRQVETEVSGIASKLQEWGEEVSSRDWKEEFRGRRSGWSKRPPRRNARRRETEEDNWA